MTPRKWTSFLLVALMLISTSLAPTHANASAKRSLAAVLFASLGGAIVGLSTLSFYGEPQEHTNSITLGALVGFAGGVGYAVYDSSRPTPPMYEYGSVFEREQLNRKALVTNTKASPMVSVTFNF